MKTFCPNCECERETTLYSEVRECTVCREGFEIVCGTQQSNPKKSKADEVMEIIAAALSGDCQKYLNYDADGNKYCKWGIVEQDIRATLDVPDTANSFLKGRRVADLKREIENLQVNLANREAEIADMECKYEVMKNKANDLQAVLDSRYVRFQFDGRHVSVCKVDDETLQITGRPVSLTDMIEYWKKKFIETHEQKVRARVEANLLRGQRDEVVELYLRALKEIKRLKQEQPK